MIDDHRSPPIASCGRPRFRLLTALLISLLILAAIVGTMIKLEQDHLRSAAFRELTEMGFDIEVGGRGSVRYVRSGRSLSASQLDQLPTLLSDWTRPHDLGFSAGLDLQMVDLRGSGANDELVQELRARFPTAEVMR